MHVQHSADLWRDTPGLVPAVLQVVGMPDASAVDARVPECELRARSRLGDGTESDLPEVQAWRRVFSAMGLRPTQYRCASEALLRRFRRVGAMPRLHSLVDLCNAASLASAVPIAVFDLARVDRALEVRHATGEETYLSFSGDVEHPEPGEVIYADASGRAHARRWTHRQSAFSAVRPSTIEAVVVVEGVHERAGIDVPAVAAELGAALATAGSSVVGSWVLSATGPRATLVPSGTGDGSVGWPGLAPS